MTQLEIGICWGTLQQASVLEMIEAAGRHGFPTITLMPEQVIATMASGVSAAQLRARLRDAGTRVRVIDAMANALPGQGEPGARSNEEDCYRAAEALDAPMINVTHYGGRPTPRQAIVDTLGEICARADARGVDIVVEFLPDTGFPDLPQTATMIREAHARKCAIVLDPWHLARTGGGVEDVKALSPGLIGAMQLCDRTPPLPGAVYVPMSGRDLPGEGQLPLCELVRAALANNPGITVELEVFSQELKNLSIDAAAARTARAVKAWRDTCGL